MNEQISSAIALHQVELATKIDGLKKMLENIFSLYTKLCDVPLFTQEVQRHIDHLERDLKKIGNILQQFPSQGQSYFQNLLSAQGQLASLQAQDANIRATLINIHSMLIPHMEVLHKELSYAEIFMKKDPHLSTNEGLVTLATELDIQVKSLEVACDNWDTTLKIIMEVHKPFLNKHTIHVPPMT